MSKKQQQAQTDFPEDRVTAAVEPQSSNAVALAQRFTPPELLHQAILKKSDISVIERMAALAERWQEAQIKRESRIAFINAMVDAKAEMPILTKNRLVQFKSQKPGAADTSYWHEDLAMVVETAQPVLAKHGLTFSWRTEQPAAGQVTVTCILEHRGGHFTENQITAAVDTSGNKNHLQAIKSAITYLERMTALAAVGLAARGHDDDGREGGIKKEEGPVITAEQEEHLLALLAKKGRTPLQFINWTQTGIENVGQLPADLYDDCILQLNKMPDVAAAKH